MIDNRVNLSESGEVACASNLSTSESFNRAQLSFLRMPPAPTALTKSLAFLLISSFILMNHFDSLDSLDRF